MTTASGAIAETTNYMPFGEQREHTGSNISNYKFTDQELDPETGLYYYGARYYDPIIGRFISPDSIVQDPFDPQTLNRYTYCRNNPLIYIDPSGYGWAEVIGAVVGAVVGAYAAEQAGGEGWKGAIVGAVAGYTGAYVGTSVYTVLGGSGWFASIVGGAAGGATAGVVSGAGNALMYGGNVWQGVYQGAMYGALSGAVFGAIGAYYGDSWGLDRVAMYGVAGGSLSELAGGDFTQGAIYSLAVASAAYLYKAIVGFNPDREWREVYQEKNYFTFPETGYCHIGEQGIPLNGKFWHDFSLEGGFISKTVNYIPGVNQVAALHDNFQIAIERVGGSLARTILNYPGMPIAAAITTATLATDTPTMVIYMINSKRR